ncbi:MAG: hypothetical protein H5U36_03240 [Candidatus Caldatribacterium sp.]|nr:hypothetical protein [Candidatus Caldatribacterium sp.]
MRLEEIFFVEIPSLFEEGRKVVIGSKDFLRKRYQRAFFFLKTSGNPFFLYRVVSFSPDAETLNRARQCEENLRTEWQKEYESALGRDILALFLFVLLSYAIWNMGFIFQAVDALFMLAGDYLNPYARVVLILAPLIYGVYRKLLIGDTIFAKRRAFSFLGLWRYLERPLQADFVRDLQKFIATSTSPARGILETLLQAVRDGDEEKARRLVGELRKVPLPFKERRQVDSLCDELEVLLAGNFSPRVYRVETSEILTSFFSSEEYESLALEVQRLARELPHSSQALAETLLLLEQTLCREVRGKVTDEILEPILEYYQGTRIDLFSGKRSREVDAPFGRRNPFPSLPVAIFLGFASLALSLFLFSLHLVDAEDFLVVRTLKPGWQGFVGERLEVVDEGISVGSKKLLLATPRPFAFAHRATRKPQTVDALLLLREVAPAPSGDILGMLRYLWDKGMAFFKEGYGNDFVVLRVSFTFKVTDPERWKQYDFDGRGKERLSRDLETYLLSYMDKVRDKYRQTLFEEGYEEARTKLEEVSKSRTFREWVRRFLYPSPLDTYRVGSVYDMYLIGLEWLKRHPHMENNPEWQTFVDHEIALIREKMQKEHDELIANPFRVREIVRNPNTLALSEYPGLYQTLLFMAVNEVVTGMFLEDLEREDFRKTFGEEALQHLEENGGLFPNIGVALLEVRVVLARVSYLYYLRYLQKRQNLL